MKKYIVIFLALTIFALVFIEACGNPFFPGLRNTTGLNGGGTGTSGITIGEENETPAAEDENGTPTFDSFGKVSWVSTLTGAEEGLGDVVAQFCGVAVDQSGNVYVLGSQNSDSTYSYGAGPAFVVRGKAGLNNFILLKYNADGNAQWAKAIMKNSISCVSVNAVTIDQAGNIYIAGYQGGNSIDYGNGVSSIGPRDDYNPALVKYDSNGDAKWAYTITDPKNNGKAEFTALAVDHKGNVYATGYQTGNGLYTYGDGVTINGTSSADNPVLVKIEDKGNEGKAIWAHTVTGGDAVFMTVAVDATGDVYVAGCQNGLATYTYGDNVTAAGKTSYNNSVLVKYDSGGAAQWARTPEAASGASEFYYAAVDEAGNIYLAGSASNIPVLVKYNMSGNVLWTWKPEKYEPVAGTRGVTFSSIVVDKAGYVYAAGSQSGLCYYGNGVSVIYINNKKASSLLVKYDAGGNARGAWIINEGTEESGFLDIALDPSSDCLYAVGYQNTDGDFDYGNDVVVNGIGDENPTLVKFDK